MDQVKLLDQAIEDRFFRAILHHEKLLEITSNSLKEENFSTSQKARLWRCIISYYEEYKAVPTQDLLGVTIKEMYTPEQATMVLRLLEKIIKLPPPEWQWIVSKIDEYVKTIHLQKSLYEASEKLQNGNFKDAENTLVNSIRHSGILSGRASNDIDLTKSNIYDIAKNDDSFCCPTRIYALDDYIRGLYRKELFLVMAPLNVGKSWATVHLATSSLLSSKHVLYLTLEMSRERVMQRILQNISGTYTPRNNEDLDRVIQAWDEDFTYMEDTPKRSLLDLEKVHKNLTILKKFGGMLSVREYPSGTCTVNDVEKDVMMYDVTFGKLPDVVVVDGLLDLNYVGATDTNRQRLGLTQSVRKLRKIASDYNCCMVTTHQGNRESIGADVVGTQHTGESLGIVQVSDTGISLNQTKAEQQLGKMRISVMRARNQKKWGMVEIWQNLDIGQFCQVSKRVSSTDYDSEKEPKTKRKYVRRNE